MDGYLFTEDMDLSSVLTRNDLAAMLRVVHVRADRPSLRTLEAEARYYKTPLSKTVVSEMLKGTRFPRKAAMLSFLRACGVAEEAMEPWRHTWERIAATESGGRPRLQLGELDDGRPRSASQAVQDTSEPMPLVGRKNTMLGGGVTRLLPEAADLADGPGRRNELDGAPGPPVSRRQLGTQLRQLRFNAGLTIEQAAERLLCSPSKISRMETGFRAGTLRDIRDLCDLYAVTDQAQRDRLIELVRQSRRQGWWQSYDVPFDVRFGAYLGLEGGAASISVFCATLIPGLLQTADYARTLMAGFGNNDPDVVERYVAVRIRRQELLDQDNPPQLNVVVDEAALRRRVGSAATMRSQLDQVVARGSLPNISVRVIPFSHGVYKAIEGGSFTILKFPGQMKEIVYTEGLFGAMYLERPQDIERFNDAFENMRSASANDRESFDLIAKIRNANEVC